MLKPAELYTHTHTQLKRCLAFLLFIIIPYNSFAVDACVENDSVTIVLDASINGTNRDYVRYTKEFTVNFPYGTVSGIGACLSADYQWNSDKTILTDDGATVVGGENNGSYCFCKTVYPIVTRFFGPIKDPAGYASTGENCHEHCGGNCSWNITNIVNDRKFIFQFVQN